MNNISHSAIYYKTILNEQRETEENSFKVVPLASNTFCVMFDDFYRNWNQNTIVMAQREKQSRVNNIGILHVSSFMSKNLSLPAFWKVIIGNSEAGGGVGGMKLLS